MQSTQKSRMTRQRAIILEELRMVTSHPTVDEVFQMVRNSLPNISLATVYRNLDLLTTAGLIQKIELPGSQMRFDGNPNHHYHMRCNDCSVVKDISIKPISAIDGAIKNIDEYEITSYRLEFSGLCNKCNYRSRPKGE